MTCQSFLPARAAGASASADGRPVSQTVMPLRGLVSAGGAAGAPPTAKVPARRRKRLTKRRHMAISWKGLVPVGVNVAQKYIGSRRHFTTPTGHSPRRGVYQSAVGIT